MSLSEQEIEAYRERLRCKSDPVQKVFADAVTEAVRHLSAEGMDHYLEAASRICGLGRGSEPVLSFLESGPGIADIAGSEVLEDIADTVGMLSRTANAPAIVPFLSTLAAVTRRLEERELLVDYFRLVEEMAHEAGQALPPMFERVATLLDEISIGGLKNWMATGLRGYRNAPHRVADYFAMQTADSVAAVQRERQGTLYVDHERRLALYLRALWELEEACHPFSLAFDNLRQPVPHIDARGFHVPDVYEDLGGVAGVDRYRALLAHMAAHRWWTKPMVADNYSPFQQLVIETFEDCRVEQLAIRHVPGLRRLWLALHPKPVEGECEPGWACIRHKLAMFSRAVLDPDHGYTDPVVLDFVERFRQGIADDPEDQTLSTRLGVQFLTKIQDPDFRSPHVWFKDTEVSYRDDNRFLWHFLEDTDKEDDFHSDHGVTNPRQMEPDAFTLARHISEWDAGSGQYRPDWVTVYESLQPAGPPDHVDELLAKNHLLAKRIRRIVDLLKPQQHQRVRYQEDGDELDLDVAIRSVIDYRAGTNPDPRIHFRLEHAGRDIAVVLLLDLSESINETPPGLDTTIGELSLEAVSLLAWAVDALGDPFAIAGFASNTRHQVRYTHFKGFNEPWGPEPKGRLAAMEGGYSTRMGAALRTAGHYLSKRDNDKKLLLVLSDGEPYDIDVDDPDYLKADTHKAVAELASDGIATHCITLDPYADDYVGAIFGEAGYTVVDHIERLPERLPQLFMSLTQ